MAKVHFLDVGCADTTIIESNGGVIIVDCCKDLINHASLLPASKSIKAVFITHQHYDHFLGLEYLKNNYYSIEYLIYSPYERRYSDNSIEYEEWNSFNNFVTYFKNKGTKIYTPYRQNSFDEPWWTVLGLNVWMIGPEKSIATNSTRELHDASLVLTLIGSRRCCFAGDASDTSLNWIAKNTNNYCDDILHVSHHGSINGADLDFIKNANIKNSIISTKSGVHSNVPDSTAIQRYNTYTQLEVLRTDVKGSIHWDF